MKYRKTILVLQLSAIISCYIFWEFAEPLPNFNVQSAKQLSALFTDFENRGIISFEQPEASAKREYVRDMLLGASDRRQQLWRERLNLFVVIAIIATTVPMILTLINPSGSRKT